MKNITTEKLYEFTRMTTPIAAALACTAFISGAVLSSHTLHLTGIFAAFAVILSSTVMVVTDIRMNRRDK